MKQFESNHFKLTPNDSRSGVSHSQMGRVIWITGLSGAGKTSLGAEIKKVFLTKNLNPIHLDGDSMRKGLFESIIINNDYGDASRRTFGMAYARLSLLLASQGFLVITTVMTMYEEILSWNRKHLPGYFEVYLQTPLEELKIRDSKKIYSRQKAGALKNVVGIDLKFQEPKTPDLVLPFDEPFSIESKAEKIINSIETTFQTISHSSKSKKKAR